MVDMALLQSVSYIAGALGVFMAAVYYVITLRAHQANIMCTSQLWCTEPTGWYMLDMARRFKRESDKNGPMSLIEQKLDILVDSTAYAHSKQDAFNRFA